MINFDLSNTKKWSEDWLITFNPDKTDIMLFDSRRQGNLNFKFGQPTYYLLTSINTWVLFSVLTINEHDILTICYLKHPSMYVFYEN